MTSKIDAGITIEGSIRGEGALEVSGRVRGALTLQGDLVVQPGGIVEADVDAHRVRVAGVMSGSVTALESVSVVPGGRLDARVRTPELLVDEGAVFRGELQSPAEGPRGGPPGLPAPDVAKGMSKGRVRGRAPGFKAPSGVATADRGAGKTAVITPGVVPRMPGLPRGRTTMSRRGGES